MGSRHARRAPGSRDRLERRLADPAERDELERQDVHPRQLGRGRRAQPRRARAHQRAGGRGALRAIGAYRATDGGRTLELHYTTNSAYDHERVEVVERSDRVVVASFERAPNGPVTLAAVERVVTAHLAAPLGARRVVDAESGRTLRRR